jgi:hypothetical protein
MTTMALPVWPHCSTGASLPTRSPPSLGERGQDHDAPSDLRPLPWAYLAEPALDFGAARADNGPVSGRAKAHPGVSLQTIKKLGRNRGNSNAP